ncbi:MAG: hypothetical protein QXW94_05350, partial [Desulfurococcaceae archaeon]
DSTSFVGDIDPGSQMAFRITMKDVNNESDVVKLAIRYSNVFNEQQQRELNVSITRIVVEEKPSIEAPSPYYGLIALVATGTFMVLVGLLIYKLYRSHMRKLKSEVPAQ